MYNTIVKEFNILLLRQIPSKDYIFDTINSIDENNTHTGDLI